MVAGWRQPAPFKSCVNTALCLHCICACAHLRLFLRVWLTSVLCGPAKAISWELPVFTWPLKRGCYQPWSRCSFSFTLDTVLRRQTQTHMHTCTKSLFWTRTHAHTHTHTSPPSPEWPSRRACLCQQMSGRRCVFLCLSLHSFHLLLQRLPICLWPCFISAHSNLSPKRTPVRLFYYRHTGIVYYKKTNPPLLSMQLCWIDTTFKITLLGFDLRS